MKPGFRVVMSGENSPYMAWQAKVFHYSCVTYLHHTPIVVVHDLDEELHPYFRDIARAGGLICPAPAYRVARHGGIYCARNTPASLLHALDVRLPGDEYFVLCDPDLIFLREPELPAALYGSFYDSLDFRQAWVQDAARAFGVSVEEMLRREELRCGVPHVVPVRDARRFAETWIDAIDVFQPDVDWSISMFAFGIAAMKLGHEVACSAVMQTNWDQAATPARPVIHYAFGDERWNKRHFMYADQVARVWDAWIEPAEEGTVLGEVLRQIQGARDFYAGLGCHSRELPLASVAQPGTAEGR